MQKPPKRVAFCFVPILCPFRAPAVPCGFAERAEMTFGCRALSPRVRHSLTIGQKHSRAPPDSPKPFCACAVPRTATRCGAARDLLGFIVQIEPRPGFTVTEARELDRRLQDYAEAHELELGGDHFVRTVSAEHRSLSATDHALQLPGPAEPTRPAPRAGPGVR